MTGRSAAYVAVGLGIGGLLLALAVRQVDWRAVGLAIQHVSLPWLALGATGLAATQWLTAVRWRVIVNAGEQISLADAFDFMMIGNLAGLVLPSRLGDVARAVAAGRYHALSASRLLGTILVERLSDVIALLVFGVALAWLMRIPPGVQGALLTLLVAAAAVLAVLWMGEAGPLGFVSRWLTRVCGEESRARMLFVRFSGGIGAVRDHGRVAPALMMALLVWVGSAVTARCNMAAFGVEAPWYASAFVVVVVNLGGIIPAPPAGIGVYHYLAALALSPWVADSSTALAFALVTHAVSVLMTIAMGTGSLLRKGLSIGGLRRMAAAGAPPARMP